MQLDRNNTTISVKVASTFILSPDFYLIGEHFKPPTPISTAMSGIEIVVSGCSWKTTAGSFHDNLHADHPHEYRWTLYHVF